MYEVVCRIGGVSRPVVGGVSNTSRFSLTSRVFPYEETNLV